MEDKLNNKGSLIVFEGMDQSGKGTQSRLFVKRLKELGYKAEYMHFHDTDTPLGKEIQLFLEGKRNYSPTVRQLLFTANRYERAEYIENALEKNDFLIIDRYIPSGLAYGIANDLELGWMLELERKLPQPDVVVLIDISSKTSSTRKHEDRRDVYERNYSFLDRVKHSYLDLAGRFDYIIINGEKELKLVHNEIWEKVWDRIK